MWGSSPEPAVGVLTAGTWQEPPADYVRVQSAYPNAHGFHVGLQSRRAETSAGAHSASRLPPTGLIASGGGSDPGMAR
jgi:hypothetical protein